MNYVHSLFKAIFCGSMGGITSGSLLGIAYALAAGGEYLEAWLVFVWTGAWVGLVIGGLIGGAIGLTLPLTEQYLKQIALSVGIVTVGLIAILLSLFVDDLWIRAVAVSYCRNGGWAFRWDTRLSLLPVAFSIISSYEYNLTPAR